MNSLIFFGVLRDRLLPNFYNMHPRPHPGKSSVEKTCNYNKTSVILKKVLGHSSKFHAVSNERFLRFSFFEFIFRKEDSIRKMQIYYDKRNISVHLNVDNSHSNDSHYNQYLYEIKKYLRFKQYNLIINTPSTEIEDSYESYMISSAQKSTVANTPCCL